MPYTIKLDKQKLVELLHELDISEEVIRGLVINVKKINPRESASYEYGGGRNIINLFGDDIWKEYREAIEGAKGIVDKKNEKIDSFEDFLFTGKLPAYLNIAPRERGLAFADKLFRKALNRELNADFLHEAKHLADNSHGKYKLWFIFGDIVDALGFLESFDKAEKSAINFQNQMKNNQRWRNIVTILPKNT